jgi:hypothetical protein
VHPQLPATPFEHRDPGVFGAAWTNEQLNTEIIVDGIHSHLARRASFPLTMTFCPPKSYSPSSIPFARIASVMRWTNEQLNTEIIVDGIHSHPASVHIAYKQKGNEHKQYVQKQDVNEYHQL